MALRYALLLAAVALASTAAAQGDLPFRDDFDGASLGPNWEPTLGDWFVEDGFARNEGESTADFLSSSQPYGAVRYEVETRFDLSQGGTFFFGGESLGGLEGYQLSVGRVGWVSDLTAVRLSSLSDGGPRTGVVSRPLGGAIAAPLPTPIGGDAVGVRVVGDGVSGVIEVYVDQGTGFGQKPLLRVLDDAHPDLGFIGFRVYNEPTRLGLVDYVEVRAGAPLPALVTDVGAASGAGYERGVLNGDYYALPGLYPDEGLYADRPASTHRITSVPFELQNAEFVRVANDDKAATAPDFLTFTLSQAATVYVGYDPRATALPEWLQDWTRTGDVIRVVDPQIDFLDVYARDFEAGPVTLGGTLAAPAAGAESSYLVAAAAGTPYVSRRADAARAELDGPRVAQDWPFFTGAGFADFLAPSGDAVEWDLFATQSYRHVLGFRYALAEGDRPLEIRVNGRVVEPSLSFPATGGWDRWATARLVVRLEPGLNTVTATAVGQSGPNVDALLLDDVDLVGSSGAAGPRTASAASSEAAAFALEPAAPNPTAGAAAIAFSLPEDVAVRLVVYDVLGREVARLVDGPRPAGRHTATFDGAALPGGAYLVRLEAGGRTLTRQLTVAR